MKVAVLYLSHLISDSFFDRYHKLVKEIGHQYDVYWVFQTDNGISSEPLNEKGVNVFGFNLDDLNKLNYSPLYERIFGSEHFITAFFSKEHPEYLEEAHQATYELQNGNRGYYALWQHILNVSIADLRKNYGNLSVEFDLWKKESDAQPYIPDMVKYLKDNGYAHLDQGALVVDVKEETDTKEVPPCMILKSDGSSLYNTTDLATLVMRRELYDPDQVIYVVDKRQELYFTQVFRCARKTGIVREDTQLDFLGFGTMNGKDGKPFKTRQGGVMRLEYLISDIQEEMYRKIIENHEADPDEARQTARLVALSALKYGDLSNQASKDYIFDIKKFIEFEGNTGPYILYTIVRIKSILARYGKEPSGVVKFTGEKSEKDLMLKVAGFTEMMGEAYRELAPHKVCAYIYELANIFNTFYHDVRIIACEDEEKKDSYVSLISLTKAVLETCIDILGFSAPERM